MPKRCTQGPPKRSAPKGSKIDVASACADLLQPAEKPQCGTIRDLPPALVPLAMFALPLIEQHAPKKRDLDTLEVFAGCAAISRAVSALGLRSCAVDKEYSKVGQQDLCTPTGFLYTLKQLLRVRVGGGLWQAPECKTWIWIGRKQTGRSASNPTGGLENGKVLKANQMCIFASILYVVGYLRGLTLCMEQPSSTILHMFSPMKEVLAHCLPHTVTTYLGSYGASSCKPVIIYSSSAAVETLKMTRPKNQNLQALTTRKDGAVTGCVALLRESQAYPMQFGHAVACLFRGVASKECLQNAFGPLPMLQKRSFSAFVDDGPQFDSD